MQKFEFAALKKHVENTAAAELAETLFYIEHGYCESWAEEHRRPGDSGIGMKL